MQTLILNHYPPVITQIKEIQQIAKAEDKEFSKLNESINEVIRNMFVFTANETGVQKFEKLLGIKLKELQSLEERKLYILYMLNRKKMSLRELYILLSSYSHEIELMPYFNEDELRIKTGDNTSNIRVIFKILDDFMPLNVQIYFSIEFIALIEFLISFNELTMETTIIWIGDIKSAWHLDGSELLDGIRLLNSVKWKQSAAIELETTWQMAEGFDNMELIMQKDMWRLDGNISLDGSRLLDATEYKEAL